MILSQSDHGAQALTLLGAVIGLTLAVCLGIYLLITKRRP